MNTPRAPVQPSTRPALRAFHLHLSAFCSLAMRLSVKSGQVFWVLGHCHNTSIEKTAAEGGLDSVLVVPSPLSCCWWHQNLLAALLSHKSANYVKSLLGNCGAIIKQVPFNW